MVNLFANLHKWVRRQNENFVTESFAFILDRLLEAEPPLANELIRLLCFGDDNSISLDGQSWQVSTQESIPGMGKPDIWLRWPKRALILIEVKRWSGLGATQLRRYRGILADSGMEITRLVLLTEWRMNERPDDESADHETRWHRVAKWLRSNPPTDPVAKLLVDQFVTFLEDQRMAVQQVGQEMLTGIEHFRRLLTMLSKALHDCQSKLKLERSFASWGCGYYVHTPTHRAFIIGVAFSNPGTIVFRFDKAECDEAKFASLGGVIVDGCRRLDLTLDSGFFDMSADEQLNRIGGFVNQSFERLKGCIKSSPPALAT
jgi:hypothetical protein